MRANSVIAASLKLLIEAAVVFSPALLFLFTYSEEFQVPRGALVQHCLVVASALLLYISLRINVHAWGGESRPALWVSTACASVTLVVGGAFYGLQYAGLRYWGNLPTWPLVRAYLPLLRSTIEQAQLNPAMVLVAMAMIVLALVTSVYLLLDRLGYASKRLVVRSRLIAMMLIGISAICVQRSVDAALWSEASWSRREPLNGFFRSAPASFVQGHKVSPVQMEELQELEDQERQHLPHPTNKRNIVVIVVDALRAQNLRRYGYPRDTTPYLDQLDSMIDSVTIDRAYSVCNESTCGIIAIAASRFVHSIIPRMITTNEVLRASGYRTYYLVSGDHTNFYGLREFYGENDGYVDGTTQNSRHLNDDRNILEGLDQLTLTQDEPFFLHIHLKSTHALGIRWSDDAPFQPSSNYTRLVVTGGTRGLDPTPYVNYYDNGIRQTDEVIRRIVENLRNRGLLENALLVVTSDHGESLGEHHKWSHANSVEEHALRIPLIFMSFGRPLSDSLHRQQVAFQVDIAPTILSEIGATPPGTWQGSALQDPPARRISFFSQGESYGLYETIPDGELFKYWRSEGRRHGIRIGSDGRSRETPLSDSELRERAPEWDATLIPLTAAIMESRPLCTSSTQSAVLQETCGMP